MLKRWTISMIWVFAAYLAIGQSPLDERITLKINNLPLRDALYTLLDQGVRISFNNNILPPEKYITLNARERPVGDVLAIFLDNTNLDFEIVGSQIVLVLKPTPVKKRKYTLSGFVTDAENGERIISATIYDEKRRTGTFTNEFGYFSLTLEEGPTSLHISSLGYHTDTIDLKLKSNQKLEIGLQQYVLQEVLVSFFKDSTFLETNINSIDINMEQAQRLPSLGGETDLVRLAYTMPGIQTGADGFGGIAVRGGEIDQNLFLLDGTTIYNATHGLGIYSIYNTGTVRSAKILKGNFPAQYGGRISSIWDIQTKEGNYNEIEGGAEFGPSSLQLNLEGPLAKGNGSWFISGRRALFDVWGQPISAKIRQNQNAGGYLNYFFYDLNAKVNYKIGSRDRVYLSFYQGKDFYENKYSQKSWYTDTLSVVSKSEFVKWGNKMASLRWNHLVSDKLFANMMASYTEYEYVSDDIGDLQLIKDTALVYRTIDFLWYKSKIKDISWKTDFDYSARPNHRFRFGTNFTYHQFQPGVLSFDKLTILDDETRDTIGSYLKPRLKSNELDVYAQDEMKISNSINANIGLRASALWVEGKPIFSLQPRLIVNFWEDEPISLSFSITRNTQFLHLLSPTNLGLPKDLWVTATNKVKPQQSWQFVLGAKHQIRSWLSLEMDGYFKTLRNLIIFKSEVLENVNATNWQDKVVVGKGWAYGGELLLKLQRKKMGGWLGYTYAHSNRFFGDEINNGNSYPHRLDRRHNLSLQFLYKLNNKWDFSTGYSIASGTAYTLATQQFEVVQIGEGNAPTDLDYVIRVAKEINGFRLPVYHRLDINASRYFTVWNVKHTLKLGVYNVYRQMNPVYNFVRDKINTDGTVETQVIALTLLPIFPTIRYIIEFK